MNIFHVNTMESCYKIDEKTDFWRILALFRFETDPKICPLGAHILHTSKSSSSEYELLPIV